MTTVREWLTAMLDVHINCLWAVGLSAVVSAIIGYKWSANKLREANRRINVENLPLGGGPDGGMRL